jgi:hypothetical protein
MRGARWLRPGARRAARLGAALPFLLLLLLWGEGGGQGEGGGREEEREEGVKGGEVSGQYSFRDFNTETWNSSQRVKLEDDERVYFRAVGGADCFIAGTDWARSFRDTGCVCALSYFGPQCGIPQSAWESHYKHNKAGLMKLRPRRTPRRLIHGLQVNHEFDLFEARLEMLKDVVDVYIVLESNFSTYGEAKPLSFLQKLQAGWMAPLQDRLLYVLLPFFPKAGETNGWYADSFLRLYLGKAGMQMVDNMRDDDIFLMLDADELPTAESLLFLKLFDGWTEPVKFGFRWTVFGFYWLKAEDPGMLSALAGLVGVAVRPTKERLLTLYVACTVAMLREGEWGLAGDGWSTLCTQSTATTGCCCGEMSGPTAFSRTG